MTIASRLKSLHLDEDDIWISPSAAKTHYPEDGNEFCFAVEDSSFWFKHRNDCILSVIDLFPPTGTILDIGGGNGFVAKRILEEGYQVAVLEPGREGALNAKKIRELPEVINTTFDGAQFPDGFLSAVSLFDVIEHIENDRDFLEKIWRALKPDGYVYITVPAHEFLWSSSDIYAEHFRRYNRKTVKDLVGKKFSLVFFTYFFSPLLIPTLLFRTLPYRLFPKRETQVLSTEAEHGLKYKAAINALSFLLKKELNRIQSGQQLKLGTSCLCVIQKISS